MPFSVWRVARRIAAVLTPGSRSDRRRPGPAEDPTHQIMAPFELTEFRSTSNVLAMLARAATDPEQEVRYQAVHVVVRYVRLPLDGCRQVATALLWATRDEDEAVRREACEALAVLTGDDPSPPPQVGAALVSALTDADIDVVLAATGALARIHLTPAERGHLVDQLIASLTRADALSRWAAAKAARDRIRRLAGLGPDLSAMWSTTADPAEAFGDRVGALADALAACCREDTQQGPIGIETVVAAAIALHGLDLNRDAAVSGLIRLFANPPTRYHPWLFEAVDGLGRYFAEQPEDRLATALLNAMDGQVLSNLNGLGWRARQHLAEAAQRPSHRATVRRAAVLASLVRVGQSDDYSVALAELIELAR